MSPPGLPLAVIKDEQAKLCVLIHKWCGENAVTHFHASNGYCCLSGDRKHAVMCAAVSADRTGVAYAGVYSVERNYNAHRIGPLGIARSADLMLDLLSALKHLIKEPQCDKHPVRRSPRLNAK